MAEVKGNYLSSRPRYVLEEHGREVFQRVAERLEGPTREAFENPPLPFTWNPFELLMAMDQAIIAEAMGGDVTQMRRFGQLIARYDLSLVYKVLFRVGTPSFVLGRSGMAYKQYIRGGEMSSKTESDAGVVELERIALPRYLCEYGVSGWLESAVEMSGGRDVTVSHEACRHRGSVRCSWRLSWT